MIRIDRSASTPPFEQLVSQLRFQIMAGKYKPGNLLPSTRELGAQLGLSFHTVQRAYSRLAADGYVKAEPGRGFRVGHPPVLPKGERMEKGADIMQETLRQLAALGLSEREIDYTFQESIAYFDTASSERKIVLATPFLEIAEIISVQAEKTLQENVLPVTLDALSNHPDADLVLAPMPHVIAATEIMEEVPVRGLMIHFTPDVLDPIARMLPHESLGVVTGYPDTITPVLSELKTQTCFRSQVVATALDAPERSVKNLLRNVDLLAFTPKCSRRVKRLAETAMRVELRWTINSHSLEILRSL